MRLFSFFSSAAPIFSLVRVVRVGISRSAESASKTPTRHGTNNRPTMMLLLPVLVPPSPVMFSRPPVPTLANRCLSLSSVVHLVVEDVHPSMCAMGTSGFCHGGFGRNFTRQNFQVVKIRSIYGGIEFLSQIYFYLVKHRCKT